MMNLNPLSGVFYLLFMGRNGLAIIAALFWVWTLYDCISKEPSEGNDKVAWLLFILFVPVLGALVYYFVRRPERVKAQGR